MTSSSLYCLPQFVLFTDNEYRYQLLTGSTLLVVVYVISDLCISFEKKKTLKVAKRNLLSPKQIHGEMEDDSSNSASSIPSSDPSALQRKLYFLNEELQIMARELPLKYQQRIPNELLSALAESLLDNTVFSIVNTLMDIQHVTEKHLFHQRLQRIYNQSLEIQEMMLTHHDEAVRFANTNTLELKHKRDLKEFDKSCIEQLDEKVHDQQRFLEKAGVPGFEVTDNQSKIQVQIKLLDFILRLSRMKMPE